MLTILPYLALSMTGKTAWEQRNTDFKFMLTMRSQSSAVISTTFLRCAPPATLTKMSILPQRSRVDLTISSTDCLLVTSLVMAMAWVPRSATSLTRAWAASGSISATASLAPSRAKRCTIAPPMPPPPPVTMATLLSRVPMGFLPLLTVAFREIVEHNVEIWDALHFGMVKRLVVWPVRHHDDRVGLRRHVFAVFMAVVDEQFHIRLLDHL